MLHSPARQTPAGRERRRGTRPARQAASGTVGGVRPAGRTPAYVGATWTDPPAEASLVGAGFDSPVRRVRTNPRKRRELVETFQQLEPTASVADLRQFLATHGIEASERTVYRDVAYLRKKLAADPAVPEQFGFVVQILHAVIVRSFDGGTYQTTVAACRELKELLHLDEVIPSAMLKAKTAAAADASEVADLFAQLRNLTERAEPDA